MFVQILICHAHNLSYFSTKTYWLEMSRKGGYRKTSLQVVKQLEYIPSPSGESDIFNPTIVSFEGRRYRKYTGIPSGSKETDDRGSSSLYGGTSPTLPLFTDWKETCTNDGEEVFELGDVEELPNQDLQIKIDVPTTFFKYIIGKEGKTKQRVEQDTNCKLKLPRKGEKGPIILQAQTRRQLSLGKQRVEAIVWANRSKEMATHFVSIPLNDAPIMGRFIQFKEVVLARNIDQRLFQNPAKLHLTIGVLRLFSEEEELAAVETIEAVIGEIRQGTLGTDPCVIQLVGIRAMNDDDTAVDVLYAQVKLRDGSNRLKLFVDKFMSEIGQRIPNFVDQRQERDGVKLHATIMNTKFKAIAVAAPEGRDCGIQRRESFNAQTILKEFRDYDFGDTVFSKLHLSKRREYGKDGYYRCVNEFLL